MWIVSSTSKASAIQAEPIKLAQKQLASPVIATSQKYASDKELRSHPIVNDSELSQRDIVVLYEDFGHHQSTAQKIYQALVNCQTNLNMKVQDNLVPVPLVKGRERIGVKIEKTLKDYAAQSGGDQSYLKNYVFAILCLSR